MVAASVPRPGDRREPKRPGVKHLGNGGGRWAMAIDGEVLDRWSDEALFARWIESRQRRAGDTVAFEILWRRHGRWSYGVVVAALGPSQVRLAPELHQEVWLKVIQASAWRRGNFRGWLSKVAVRKALDALARHSVRLEEGEGAEEGEPLYLRAGASASLEEAMDQAARLEACRRVLGTLAPTLQEALRLWWLEDLDPSDIAARLKVPLNTVRSRLGRAIRAVREQTAGRGLLRELESAASA